MLSLISHVCGRPWAVQGEVVAHVRGMLTKEGLAGLRHLAELKHAIHALDDDDRPRAARMGAGRAVSSVAVIPIIGTMTHRGDIVGSAETVSTMALSAAVATAVAEPSVDAVVLEIDSGGGEVMGTPEAFAAIREARGTKPIVACVNSMCASAAFWLAAAADEIIVTPSGALGSVGVYALHVDQSKAIEAAGEAWTFISAGKYKLEGNPAMPLTPDALAAMQSEVDRYYGDFVRDVSKGRAVGVDTVRDGFGEGRMVGAKAAVALKMADGVGTLQEAIRRAAVLGRERRSGMAARAEAEPSTVLGRRRRYL